MTFSFWPWRRKATPSQAASALARHGAEKRRSAERLKVLRVARDMRIAMGLPLPQLLKDLPQ